MLVFIAVCLPKVLLPESYGNCDSLALKPDSLKILEELEKHHKESMIFEHVSAETLEMASLIVKYRKPSYCLIYLREEILNN